jgi:serine/threonine-protein kinase RsbW
MGNSIRNTLVFASELRNISLVEAFVDEICDEYQVFNEYYGHIMLCLTEAVRNAILHGNGSDSRKKVQIRFWSEEGALHFEVSDQGKGFDPSSVPDPTESEEGAGQGIFLIRTLSNEASWHNEGRSCRFRFDIASINYELALRRSRALSEYFRETVSKEVS